MLKTVENMLELHSSCQTLERNEGNDKRRKRASLMYKRLQFNLKLKSSSEKALAVKRGKMLTFVVIHEIILIYACILNFDWRVLTSSYFFTGNTNTCRYTGGAQLPSGESQCRSYGAFFEVVHSTNFPVPIVAAAAAAASLFAQWL